MRSQKAEAYASVDSHPFFLVILVVVAVADDDNNDDVVCKNQKPRFFVRAAKD